MKVTRSYASAESAINAKHIIQELLMAELEKITDSFSKDKSNLENHSLRGESD